MIVSVGPLRRATAAIGGNERTVAAWIRQRRLEACRRDLADPAQAARPVAAIAARRGFSTAAHFARVFKAAHGLTPQDYRRQMLRDVR